MNRVLVILLVWLVAATPVLGQSQNFGKVWLQGGGVIYTTSFTASGLVNQKWDTTTPPTFDFGHSNICDSAGNLLLACNNGTLFGAQENIIEGGDTLPELLIYTDYSGSPPVPQGSLILPFSSGIYDLVISTISDSLWYYSSTTGLPEYNYSDLLYNNRIDMTQNGGLGKVVQRKVKLLDSVKLSANHLTACRHGNGTDWWVFKHAKDTNVIYKFLFTQDSIYGPIIQGFAEPHFGLIDHGGQSIFSKDGTKYAVVNLSSYVIFLADFDRCTGELSNPRTYAVPGVWTNNPFDSTELDLYARGLAFSPNGRFLYVTKYFNVQQLDTYDPDSATAWSHIAGLDTTWEASQTYSTLNLGPDDKIYIGNWNGFAGQMSVINNPDGKGDSSDFCPKCLRFPTTYYSSGPFIGGATNPPNSPNYALGAVSPPCGLSVAPALANNATVTLYPNPTGGQVDVRYSLPAKANSSVQILDVLGRVLQETKLPTNQEKITINLSNYSSGVYYYRVLVNGNTNQSGKILLTR